MKRGASEANLGDGKASWRKQRSTTINRLPASVGRSPERAWRAFVGELHAYQPRAICASLDEFLAYVGKEARKAP